MLTGTIAFSLTGVSPCPTRKERTRPEAMASTGELLRGGSITFADGICSANWFTSSAWPREGDRVYARHSVS